LEKKARIKRLLHTEKIKIYIDMLLKWQKRLNLISPDTIATIEQRHVEDSKVLLDLIPKEKVILDIGSGGGFPGIILGIYDYKISLLDSDYRKCAFLKEVVRELKLKETRVFNCRIEDYDGAIPDVITSRALASLDKLLDFLILVSRETNVVGFFHKGIKWEEEIKQAEKKWIFDKEVFSNPNGGVILKVENVLCNKMKE
jgi:16S rRNA (guanine527-N7)-methyltransferase